MGIRIRARYADGVLTPLESTGLEPGCEVTLEISDPRPPSKDAAEPAEEREIPGLAEIAAWIQERAENPPAEGELRGLPTIVALVDELNRAIPDEAWDDVPTDLARNKDHYRFDHPKEEDEVNEREHEQLSEDEPQGLAAIVALAEKLNREFPDAWDDFPTDFAKNKKHYLYGHPKEEDE